MDFDGTGWARVGPDGRIAAWARAAASVARHAVNGAPGGWRCGGTWFTGVDALPNGPGGAVGGVPFPWGALPLDPVPLHRGQVSVVRAGYPRPDPDESQAGARYRRVRDAAHLDGLIAEGAPPRRYVREPHAWVLGIALNEAAASPLVVWEGSQSVLCAALEVALEGKPVATWNDVDITDAYVAARARVFQTCARVEVPIRPGEATLLHRLTLHGVAPWPEAAPGPEEGRMIAYFRPLAPSVEDWLRRP